MTTENLKGVIEALLFTMGNSISIKALAEVTEEDEKTVKKAMEELQADMDNDENRGIRIIELEGSYQLCSKQIYYDYLIKLTQRRNHYHLTDTVIETLAIIAYKQPVTKGMIEQIRGVSSDYAVNKLVELGLVQERGRLDAPGKPILFGTTEEFLRTFGVKNKTDLPIIDTVKIEEFKEEALEEAGADVEVGV